MIILSIYWSTNSMLFKLAFNKDHSLLKNLNYLLLLVSNHIKYKANL